MTGRGSLSPRENIDEEGIKAYIREKRRAGIRINHMAVIIAAYYKAYQTNPKLNWFVVNSHLYERNHFCVSFVILKKRADGSPDETTLKIYLEPKDTIFTINQKIADAIAVNSQTEQKNSTDKFAKMMFSIPGLPKFVKYPCTVAPGTKMAECYGESEIWERHRHRYEFNNDFRQEMQDAGLVISGTSPDGHLVETVELPGRDFHLGAQFHPEFKSRPNRAHPLFKGFIAAALRYRAAAQRDMLHL